MRICRFIIVVVATDVFDELNAGVIFEVFLYGVLVVDTGILPKKLVSYLGLPTCQHGENSEHLHRTL